MDTSSATHHQPQGVSATEPTESQISSLEAAISAERFGRYLIWAGGDRPRALELYALNIRLSEALYPSLRMLEVVLRNRINTILSDAYQPGWFKDAGLLTVPHQATRVATAAGELSRETKTATPSGIVAALTFNFWTTMLGPSYETLWQTHLHRIGRRADGRGLRRKDFSGPLTSIRILRNRIAYHEPILGWNLPQHHEAMRRMTSWLSSGAATWCFNLDRFAAVYPVHRIRLLGD